MKPQFPIIMFLTAIAMDLFVAPIIFLVTIILPPLGWLLGIFIAVLVGGIFWLWLFFKSKLHFKKTARNFVKLLSVVAVSIVPYFRLIIFEYIFLVLYEYGSEWISYLKEKRKKKKPARSLERAKAFG